MFLRKPEARTPTLPAAASSPRAMSVDIDLSDLPAVGSAASAERGGLESSPALRRLPPDTPVHRPPPELIGALLRRRL
jgi:hypothetical protein